MHALYYMHYIKCFANWMYYSISAGIRTRFAGLASRFYSLSQMGRLCYIKVHPFFLSQAGWLRHIKVHTFSIRINENLKIGYFDPISKKWLYLAFQEWQPGQFSKTSTCMFTVTLSTGPAKNFQ